MEKNILIIGPARIGKTTLSRKLNEELKYSIINLDNIISALEVFPQLKIKHNGDDLEVSSNFANFLIQYLRELSDGPNFWNGNKFVIEGTHIDFEKVIPSIDEKKFIVIGLVYNNKSGEDLYNDIKRYDTEDDWTYYCSEEELKNNINYFIERNKFFNEQFKIFNIPTYDVSIERDKVFTKILKDIKNQN